MPIKTKCLKLNGGTMVSIILYISLVFGLLHDMLGLPGALLFLNDFFILIGIIISWRKIIRSNKEIMLFIVIYFLFTIITYIINYESLFYYFYGLRNYFRFYLFFILVASVYKEVEVESKFIFLDRFFYLNCIVMTIQYFIFGFSQDHLGGFFGTSFGCNGSLNVLFIVITAKSLVYTIDNKEKLFNCVIKFGLCMLFSALCELKVYYFEFLIILIFVFLTTGFSWKKVLIVIASIGGIIVGVYLLVALFPGFAGFFTYEGAMRIIGKGSYSDSNAFNRLTFVTYFNNRILTNSTQQLIGLGLGNCDTSSIGLFATRFYDNYGWTHYDWFSAPFAYLEQGLIGILFYLCFFVVIIIKTMQLAKKKAINYTICRLAILSCVLSIVLFIYNQSMRTEAAFLMYFVMATPFIYSRSKQRIEKK